VEAEVYNGSTCWLNEGSQVRHASCLARTPPGRRCEEAASTRRPSRRPGPTFSWPGRLYVTDFAARRGAGPGAASTGRLR
jgi:hypothetical protein